MFSLICIWINGWVNNREPGDLRRYRAHYDVTELWYRCVWIVLFMFLPWSMGSSYHVRNIMMYRVLYTVVTNGWCTHSMVILVIIHQNNPLVSASTVRHSTTETHTVDLFPPPPPHPPHLSTSKSLGCLRHMIAIALGTLSSNHCSNCLIKSTRSIKIGSDVT